VQTFGPGFFSGDIAPAVNHCPLRLSCIYIFNKRRLLFWRKMLVSDNIVLAVLSRGIVSKFVAVGTRQSSLPVYGIYRPTWTSAAKIKLQIWTTFVNSLTL